MLCVLHCCKLCKNYLSYGGEVYTCSILRLRFILQFNCASAVRFCSSLLQFASAGDFAVAQSHNNHMTSTRALIRNRQENNYAGYS